MRVADYDSISSSDYDVRYRDYEHQGIETALVLFLGGPSSSGVLEVGAGTGHWLVLLDGHRVVGLDLSRAMLARAKLLVDRSVAGREWTARTNVVNTAV